MRPLGHTGMSQPHATTLPWMEPGNQWTQDLECCYHRNKALAALGERRGKVTGPEAAAVTMSQPPPSSLQPSRRPVTAQQEASEPGIFSSKNPDLMRTSRPDEDQCLVLMRQNIISEFLVEVRELTQQEREVSWVQLPAHTRANQPHLLNIITPVSCEL
ncbi:unnamed protein product [Pleuronectes platessa]|uniref:Uncharacterized protein n=1 Tax=Pleuronectes platessa TaxID=8262 RepID=A0A9N7YCN9_PLEPL|nr:unnamed protein product [Pleuronectes platessa]